MFYNVELSSESELNDLRNANLLIKNQILAPIDSNSDIELAEKTGSILCNKYTGQCKDQYVEVMEYADYRLNHYGKVIEDFSIDLHK